MKKVFICFDPTRELDKEIAQSLIRDLGASFSFLGSSNQDNGLEWAKQTEAELDQADLVVVLLSKEVLQSEVIAFQVARAYHYSQEFAGQPIILPIRLNNSLPYPYPLSTFLEGLPWLECNNSQELPQLLPKIIELTEGQAAEVTNQLSSQTNLSAPGLQAPFFTASLEQPEGTMDPQSAFYIKRSADGLALTTIRQLGVTITIKGPRQMGKSSLLMRTIAEARKYQKKVALLDFQFLDSSSLESAELFLRQFCTWLSYTLKVEDLTATYWRLPLGNVQRCTAYLEDHLLPEVGQPLVLALDEVDKVFEAPFRSDFFGMLRGWHNRRQSASVWKQLDLVLVTSTEPYQLIANLNQSPFNVGQVLELEDFSLSQLHELNQRHGQPFSVQELQTLQNLLGGQPYLVRRAFYLVATGQLTSTELLTTASHERGPFGDHLRYHLFRLHDRPELVEGIWQVLDQQSLPDEQLFFRLRGAGLVKRSGSQVVPRSKLYADFFRQHLKKSSGSSQPKSVIEAKPSEKQPPPKSAAYQNLSGRELEVLQLLAAGLSNALIAEKLVLAPGTVNVHLSTIYGKLGVPSRTAAIRYALDNKLI